MHRRPVPSLTAVLHGMVKRAASGLDARTIADMVDKPYQTLMSELSRQEGHKLGADLLLPLMQVTESDAPMQFLAREMGGAFVRLPEGVNQCPPTHLQCMVSIKNFGDLMETVGSALMDGRITPTERTRIKDAGHKALVAIVTLLCSVDADAEPRP